MREHSGVINTKQKYCCRLESARTGFILSLKAQVELFAKPHQDGIFYGYAVDCNAYYSNVLFCLNTIESLNETAKEYAEQDDEVSFTQERRELEWSLGDWKYLGFNLDSPSWEDKVPFLDEYSELSDNQQTEEFLIACFIALVRAEQDGVISALSCTNGLRVACMDHGEDIETGAVVLSAYDYPPNKAARIAMLGRSLCSRQLPKV